LPEDAGLPDFDRGGEDWAAYDYKTFFSILQEYRDAAGCDFVLAVTNQPIAGEEVEEKVPPSKEARSDAGNDDASAVKKRTVKLYNNYFSRSDFEGKYGGKLGVVTTWEERAQHRGPTATLQQYLAYLLMCEVLILRAEQNLSHDKSHRCLFDECQNNRTLAACIDAAIICPACEEVLKSKDFKPEEMKAVLCVLRFCKRNQWDGVLRYLKGNQLVTNWIWGVVIAGVLTYFFTRESWCYVVPAMTVVLLLAVMLYAKFFLK
jgi:hypothetical protein